MKPINYLNVVWLAVDSTGGREIELLYDWYKLLSRDGKRFGYLVNSSKSLLMVETQDLSDEVKFVFGKGKSE